MNNPSDSEDIRQMLESVDSDDQIMENYSPISSELEDDPNDLDYQPRLVLVTDGTELENVATGMISDTASNSNVEIEVILNPATSASSARNSQSASSKRTHGGRERDPVWLNFNVEYDGKETPTLATCQKCSLRYSAPKVERLKAHVKKCPLQKSNESTTFSSAKSMKQVSIKSAFKNFTTASSQIDQQCAKFVYSTLVPFRVVEDPEFVKFCKMLRPSYVPPSAKRISSSLLETVHHEMTEELSEKFEGCFATIMQDGWKGAQSTPIISHCLYVEGKKVQFLNATNMKAEAKTADKCLSLLQESIREAEEKFKVTVIGVVTDSAANMTSMRKKMSEVNPAVFTYGCNVHLLNLVGKEFAESEILDEVTKVQSYIKDHTFTRESLKEMKRKQPIIPTKIRWNSSLNYIANFLENHASYVELAKLDSKMNSDIKSKIMDIRFYEDVKNLQNEAEPISAAVTKLQSDNSTVADAAAAWIEINQKCATTMSAKTFNSFKDRMDCLMTPFVCAAYLLHPIYRGKGMNSIYTEKGQNWLTGQHPDYLVPQIKLALNDTNLYSSTVMNHALVSSTGLSASQWWRYVGESLSETLQEKFPVGFCKVAEKLMMLPASTSGIERCFSTMGNIMTDLRNRIGVDKTAKLCMISRHLKSGDCLTSNQEVDDSLWD